MAKFFLKSNFQLELAIYLIIFEKRICVLGAKSLILLEASGGAASNYPEGEIETHKTFDLLNDRFEIPAERTYYNCRLHKLPEFAEKQHAVKVN